MSKSPGCGIFSKSYRDTDDANAAALAASLRRMANGHRWRYCLLWIEGPVGAALQWFEAHPGTASRLEAVDSITAIVFVYLFALFQGRRTRSHESIDRIRRAQGLALVLIPALTAFKSKIETAIMQESKPALPDEVMHLLDHLYIFGRIRRIDLADGGGASS